jgi:hypothetical protein
MEERQFDKDGKRFYEKYAEGWNYVMYVGRYRLFICENE